MKLEVDFEGHWIRIQANFLGKVTLYVDQSPVASRMKWFKPSDLPLLHAELPDGTPIQGFARTDSSGSGQFNFAIAVGGRTIART